MKKRIITLVACLAGGTALVLPSILTAPKFSDEPVIDIGEAPQFEESGKITPQDRVSRAGEGEEDEYVCPKKVILHYHNDDNQCNNRRFYTWVTGVDGVERKADSVTGTDMSIELDFTAIPEYSNTPSLFFIIKVAGTWAGQSEDTELSFTKFGKHTKEHDGILEVWTIPGEGSAIEIYKTEEETMLPKIATAKFTDFKTIHCTCANSSGVGPMNWRLYAFDKNYLRGSTDEQAANKDFYLFKEGHSVAGEEFDIVFNNTAKINVQYLLESEFAAEPTRTQKVIASFENLYENPRFESFYNYSGDDLGVTVNDNYVTFKVWSPISAFVTVNLYSSGVPKALADPEHPGVDKGTPYEMSYTAGGVWEANISREGKKDIVGQYYTYTLTNSNGVVETVDPYAKAVGINGMRGYVYDHKAASANPEDWDKVPTIWNKSGEFDISSQQDLSIYEVHIRDLTMDETWQSKKGNKRGTYNAFVESGTTYSKNGTTVTTGFDHITELGVKAVQLVPVFDHDDDERPEKMKFNWGYNPLNYNCVEGGYSSDPYDPLARIVEYKNLVKAFAENGNHTRVIMDVVYNHVSSASSSCFTKCMPKYYFRYTANWEYYDGSGCNNEVKTDATMMRKYIVDSLCWWATEYKIKGFRFDLMGLIDTWTMRAAKEALYKIDPDIYIYGEGWTSGGYHGKYEKDSNDNLINGGSETALVYQQLYASSSSPGYVGAFNDSGRNATKGSNDDGYNQNPYPQWGFMTQGSGDVGSNSDIVADMLKGMHTGKGGNPLQTVNYVSCHDNYTLWDQLRYTTAKNGYNDDHSPIGGAESAPDVHDTIRASLVAHSLVMASNGVAFIQGGEELYRTKAYSDAELEELRKGGDSAIVRPYPNFPHYAGGDPDIAIATSDVWMFGKVVTHNSYKSSDAVNSFKWDRKISVDGVDTSGYNEIWCKMIKARDNLSRYEYPANCDTPELNTWDNGNGKTAFALWNGNTEGTNGYYFVFGNRFGGNVGFGGFDNCTLVYSVGANPDFSNYTLGMKPFSVICYKKG